MKIFFRNNIVRYFAQIFVGIILFTSFSNTRQLRPAEDRRCYIVGRVTDQITGQPLTGINVLVIGSIQGDKTDDSGYYYITRLNPGKYTLRASAIGYLTEIRDSIVVLDSTTIKVNFTIREWCYQYADSARFDLQNELVRMLLGGLVILSGEEIELARKYGFKYELMGCEFICEYPYNEVVWEYLVEKYGKGWRENFKKEMSDLHKNRNK